MEDKNDPLKSSGGSLKLFIIAAVIIIAAWIIGKGVLMLISSVKQM
ncbi:MAG: hypothetical protein ABIH08_05335 [Candidatus Omnitrophota bacterium]